MARRRELNTGLLGQRLQSELRGSVVLGQPGERLKKEIAMGTNVLEAKRISLTAALIPTFNSFFAVGLVAFPGMMTGQILSGIDPLLAVRYQIVVMTMIMGAGGISAAIFLTFYASILQRLTKMSS